jgi:hypothetical protein
MFSPMDMVASGVIRRNGISFPKTWIKDQCISTCPWNIHYYIKGYLQLVETVISYAFWTAINASLLIICWEPLLIIGINNGSYSKIIYSYNSHTSSYTVINLLQITYKHIDKFTNTINIDIATYNLQYTSSYIICILSSVVQHTQYHISASRRREKSWTTLERLLTPSSDIL